MGKTIGVFDVEVVASGVSIIPKLNYNIIAALDMRDLDAQVLAAKADLDNAVARATRAIQERAGKRPELRIADADRT